MAEVIFHSEWINLCDSHSVSILSQRGQSNTGNTVLWKALCWNEDERPWQRHLYCIALYPTSYTIQILQDMHHDITDTDLAFGCFFLLIWHVPLKWVATHEQTEEGRDKIKRTVCGSKGRFSHILTYFVSSSSVYFLNDFPHCAPHFFHAETKKRTFPQ